eukprot:3941002-Rhodomonas_salina.9
MRLSWLIRPSGVDARLCIQHRCSFPFPLEPLLFLPPPFNSSPSHVFPTPALPFLWKQRLFWTRDGVTWSFQACDSGIEELTAW